MAPSWKNGAPRFWPAELAEACRKLYRTAHSQEIRDRAASIGSRAVSCDPHSTFTLTGLEWMALRADFQALGLTPPTDLNNWEP